MSANLRATVTDNNVDLVESDPAEVLIDGSDTPVTANGMAGYIPHPGDRLLVSQVGTQVEIVQTLNLGNLPYIERWKTAGSPQNWNSVPGGYQNILLQQESADSEGVSYNGTTGVFTIQRAGKYVITGQATMNAYQGDKFNAILIVLPDPLGSSDDYVWAFPKDVNDNNTLTFALTRKMPVGAQVWLAWENTAAVNTPPLPEEIQGGRGKTRLSLTWIAD